MTTIEIFYIEKIMIVLKANELKQNFQKVYFLISFWPRNRLKLNDVIYLTKAFSTSDTFI